MVIFYARISTNKPVVAVYLVILAAMETEITSKLSRIVKMCAANSRVSSTLAIDTFKQSFLKIT